MANKVSLPAIVSAIPNDLRNFCQRVREILSSYVTYDDLVNSGVAVPNGSGGYTASNPAYTDYTPPPAPINLTAAGAITTILLEVDDPIGYNYLAYTEFYRSATNDLSTAVKLGDSDCFIYPDPVDAKSTYYYWARFISKANVPGPYNALAGTVGSTSVDPANIINILTANGTYGDAPFYYQATDITVDGVVIPAGTYFRMAFMADLSVTNSKIANLAVDNGKIANCTIDKLRTGTVVGQEFTIGTGGNIKSGQSAWNTGTGWWIGTDGDGKALISFGSPTGSGLNWRQATGQMDYRGTITVTSWAAGVSSAAGDAPEANADRTQGALQVGTTITGGGIFMDSGGVLGIGCTTYASGSGIFAGYSGGIPKFSLEAGSNYVRVDSSNVYINANVTFTNTAGARSQLNVADGADVTSANTAAAIAGQGALATASSADWSTQVAGTGKPADNADVTNYTDNRVANALQDGSVTIIKHPLGATYSYNGSATGIIKITLPQSWTNTMMSMVVDFYQYEANKTFSLQLAGYAPSPRWASTTAKLIGSIASNNRVRFGHDGTHCCILIGETTSAWLHPKILVKDFQAGYSNYAVSQWDDGWAIGVITSLTGITVSAGADYSDTLLDANSIVGQGALATASSADWSTQVAGTGKPSDNADVTGSNTAADTSAVNGLPSTTISGWQYGATTYINGGSIYTGSVTTKQLASRTIVAGDIATSTLTATEIYGVAHINGNRLNITASGSGYTGDGGGDSAPVLTITHNLGRLPLMTWQSTGTAAQITNVKVTLTTTTIVFDQIAGDVGPIPITYQYQ